MTQTLFLCVRDTRDRGGVAWGWGSECCVGGLVMAERELQEVDRGFNNK